MLYSRWHVFPQLQICVKTVAAGERLNTRCLDFDGCLPLGSAGRSISYHILQRIAESIRSVTHIDLYVNLYLLFRQLVSKGLSTPSFGLHYAPIVHSGHSLLLHFTWDTYHEVLSAHLFGHCQKQKKLSHGKHTMLQVHTLWRKITIFVKSMYCSNLRS